MCGIVGLVFKEPPRERAVLKHMRDSMTHRGPDDAGEWWSEDGRIGLGQRRLAIIDLSPGGHQPMQNSAGDLCIVFNGEIYNYIELRDDLRQKGHSFRSASDTEVILAAYREWGSDCLTRLNGMFAFCLYDRNENRLFLARDRAGEKPLYYYDQGAQFGFASELKGLMADPEVPRRLDLVALDFYLALGYVPFDKCILSDIKKLPAAHALLYQLDTRTTRIWQYWRLPPPCSERGDDAESLVDQLDEKLSVAVHRQLVADVPIGVLLSGGIDSSLVTALAARHTSKPVRTFNISFPGSGNYDESPSARLVASHFGTVHTELEAEPASVSLMPLLAKQFDEPLADSSVIPTYLVSRLIRQHCTVALGGDGGDELFAGYAQYSSMMRRSLARCLIPRPLLLATSRAAAELLPIGFKGRGFLIGLDDSPSHGRRNGTTFFDLVARVQLLKRTLRSPPLYDEPETIRSRLLPYKNFTELQAHTTGDFLTYLPDDILCKVDRASMINSLEIRAPFLDRDVIEFAFGRVPDSSRATSSARKILLRKLAVRLLPRGLDLTRKQGFSIPLNTWFRGKWGEFMTETLTDNSQTLFDRDAIGSLLVGQQHGYENTARLFALTMFELWRRTYNVTL